MESSLQSSFLGRGEPVNMKLKELVVVSRSVMHLFKPL